MMGVELAVIRFRPLKSDSCVYTYEDDSGLVILTLYVDDILFLGASKVLYQGAADGTVRGIRNG